MTFEEAFNRIVSEFQPIREQRWLEKEYVKHTMSHNTLML